MFKPHDPLPYLGMVNPWLPTASIQPPLPFPLAPLPPPPLKGASSQG